MIRFIVTLTATGLATIFFGAIALLGSVPFPKANLTMRLASPWSRLLLFCAGARIEYRGLENIISGRPVVFASNHLSWIDIWVLAPVLPLDTKFIAKASLFKLPFLGWSMRRGGFIPIDRGRTREAIGSLRRAIDKIRGGVPVIIFPEGTRSSNGSLGQFKKGAFHLAHKAEVPIVPIAIDGSWNVFRAGRNRITPGTVRVTFHSAIPYEGKEKPIEKTMNQVREIIRETLEPTIPPAPSDQTCSLSSR